MNVTSELALRIYRQVFAGTDQPLGYTLEAAAEGVAIPAGADWYVRHHDDQLPDPYLDTLIAEVRSRSLPGLSLAGCGRLTRSGFERIRELPELSLLSLFNTEIGDASLPDIARLTNLRSLNLAGTHVTDAGIESLESLVQLEKLHLGWTHIGDAALSRLRRLGRLKMVELRGTQITDLGMKSIAEMSGLEMLGVQETAITDVGVSALAPLAPSLAHLYLGYTTASDACVGDLARLSRLRTLMLRATRVGREHEPTLRKALPLLIDGNTGPDLSQGGLIW